MRRSIYLVPIFLILVAATVFWWWTRPRPVLSVMTWSGAYGRAQAAAQMQAYGAEKHVDVRIQQWADNGTLEELRRAMAAQRAGDVVDLEMPVAVAACRAGLLEPVDTAALPPGADGAPADKDFYKGMIGRCFVASALYARMLVCAQPCGGKTMAEIFADAAEGGIGLQKTAKANLEMALLADGVAPKDVYPLLETDAGLDRAFARLDAIKAHIIWSADAVPLLRRGQIRFATALTAPVQADGTAGLSLSPYQFTEADVLAVPKGDPKAKMAMDYIRFATGAAPLAGMVKFAPYMPPRRSALKLVAALPQSPTRDFVLAQKGMTENFFAIDDDWWAAHGDALEARFRAWAG